jgi:hypothetical protein
LLIIVMIASAIIDRLLRKLLATPRHMKDPPWIPRAAAKGGKEAEVDQAGEAITGGASGSADVRGDRSGGCSFGTTDELREVPPGRRNQRRQAGDESQR